MFEGRTLLIATKHEKEKVIAPILEKELGVKCIVANNFDTDLLGTFSGEIERKDDPITTLKNKCLQAMQLTGVDLAVASEGSFGAHPSIFFVSADDELLIFIDKKNNLEIIVRELSTETNFSGKEVESEEELREFAIAALFPSHGLIVRKSLGDYSTIYKGITSWELLLDTYHKLKAGNKAVYVETDMRALYNPTRMKVIESATKKLVKKINSCCPDCKMPGFGISEYKQGLPCEICNSPTRSVISHIYTCVHCKYSKEEKYPNGNIRENPQYCDICNP